MTENGKIIYQKAIGKVVSLASKVQESASEERIISGIAHTRWATHGKVTEANCHPHHSKNNRFYIVHNGIIENFQELKKKLLEKGYIFYSDTDTEIVAKLIEDEFDGTLKSTLEKIVTKLIGAYAFAVMDTEHPDEVI
jgi:glutamine---fructose-6-phosphate transaminase (isomerizing)